MPKLRQAWAAAEVQEAYKARGEEYVPLGVHGTMVAVNI